MQKNVYLVDVSSLFFRAFYAVRPLTSPSGVPVNAIYGFLSMILKLMKDHPSPYFIFCYDRKEPSFRKDLFQDYKANRTEMPEDLVPQIPYIKSFADALGISSFDKLGYEADDLIGTIAKKFAKQDFKVHIVSGDKDFAQLVDEKIVLMDTMKDSIIDRQGVKAKWGIWPEQMIDYLAMVGDSSDNVPGVKGIGPKGAVQLLEAFQTLDGIYQHLDQIKGSTKDKLSQSKEMAYLSQKLVTIVTDIELEEDLTKYRRRPFQADDLERLLQELNFKNFDKAIAGISLDSESQDFSIPVTESVVAEVSKPIQSSVEWQRQDIDVSELNAGALKNYLDESNSLWIHWHEQGLFIAHKNQMGRLTGDPQQIGQILSRAQVKLKGHDLKSLVTGLKIEKSRDLFPMIGWDSMLAAYILKPGEKLDFANLCTRFLNQDFNHGLDQHMAPDFYFEFANPLKMALQNELERVSATSIYHDLDLPIVAVLSEMQQNGILLNKDVLSQQSQELGQDIRSLEKQIHLLAGEEFNIASPKQLARILFEKLQLPAGKKTKTGYSTDVDVLEKLKKIHPIAEQLIEYRELTKLKSTYVDALPLLVKEDGRVHSHFNQALTLTGRFSSTDPNLQNIPIRTERGAKVRRAFVAPEDKVLMSFDYSQIELRVLAHFSDDENLIKAFQDDLDIHTATAAEVFSVPLSSVTSDQRRTAKAVNFGIAYGQGAFGLAETLGISRTESSEIIKKYFAKFARVKTYIDDTIKQAREKGYVETLLGRRRYMDELQSKNAAIQKFGERAAINAPIQGTAADIVKKAMIEVSRSIPVPMILQVHDELIFEASQSEVETYFSQIRKLMEEIVQLKVPLKVNGSTGKNWDEC